MADREAFDCPDCRVLSDPTDNYCRNCGMFLAATRAMAPVGRPLPAHVAEVRTGLPVPVKRAATAVAIGAALQIGVGLAGKYLVKQAAKQALATAVSPKPARSKGARPVANQSGLADDIAAVNETVVIHRVWVRR